MKKKSLLLIFSSITISSIRGYVYAHVYYSSRVKRKSLYRKSELHICFVDFRRPYFCTNSGTLIWRPHTRLYKGAWNVSANNSEAVGHKDLILGQIVYMLVFFTFHFLGFFHWTVSNLIFSRFGLTLPILVWVRVWREYKSAWTYLSFQFQMNMKERLIFEFEMDHLRSLLLAY